MSKFPKKYGNLTVILGGQWGDEGKGKLIDIMAQQYDIIARATGGANAGHTVYIPDPNNPEKTKKFIFHLMPSGMLYPNVIGIIGNGTVIHLPTLLEEIEFLKKNDINVDGRLFISNRAHLVFDYHKKIDELQEEKKGKNQVGTTKRGIGPAYTDKISRIGIRVHDLMEFETFDSKFRKNIEYLMDKYQFEYDVNKELEEYRAIISQIKPLITDSSFYLNTALKEGKNILIEGANGTLLDIDHGTYPFCTSSNASVGGALSGAGLGASKLKSTIGIMKAYMTRVGAGPFPTELDNEIGNTLRTAGGEYGSTTGRPRRCGWFDAVASKYSATINGMTCINLTKLDVLDSFDTIKIAVGYTYKGQKIEYFPASLDAFEHIEPDYIEMPGWKEDISNARNILDLPLNAQNYIKKIEVLLEIPVEFVGVGLSREQIAVK
jgi:adenylosuccinate synthase